MQAFNLIELHDCWEMLKAHGRVATDAIPLAVQDALKVLVLLKSTAPISCCARTAERRKNSVIDAFRKSEAYCREQAENSLLPEKWHRMANEWAALAEKLSTPDEPVSDSADQSGNGDNHDERNGTSG